MLGVINRRTENAMVEGKKNKAKTKQTNLQREKKNIKNMFSEQQ